MTVSENQDNNFLSLNGLLLGGVTVLIATGIVIVMVLYSVPAAPLQIPELDPSIRLAEEADFPVGASRVVNWGDKIILIVRTGESAYFALQGTSPIDGCILRWDAVSLRVFSPCNHLTYDMHGNVVTGLTTEPLLQYSVFVRDAVVYVGGT
jgi:nitrite reductase/ring-hydroxylating ferredoxin subunit